MNIVIRTVSGRGKIKDYDSFGDEKSAKKGMDKLKNWFVTRGWEASPNNPYILEQRLTKATMKMYLVDTEDFADEDLTAST